MTTEAYAKYAARRSVDDNADGAALAEWRFFKSLDVEFEVDDVAVFNFIFLAFHAEFTSFFHFPL